MKLLFCFLFVALMSTQVEAQPASDELAAERAVELLNQARQGKDGSYEVMKKFAECAGLYKALADYLGQYSDAKKMAVTLGNTGNGARLAATYFWSAYSKKPKIAVLGIMGSQSDYYASVISIGGVNDKKVMDKMFYCASLTSLQAKIIDQLRKTY